MDDTYNMVIILIIYYVLLHITLSIIVIYGFYTNFENEIFCFQKQLVRDK